MSNGSSMDKGSSRDNVRAPGYPECRSRQLTMPDEW